MGAAWPGAEKVRAADGTETRSVLRVSALDGAAPRTLSAARDSQPHRERDLAWSPDGREIAFLSDAAHDGQLQLYVAPAAGGHPAPADPRAGPARASALVSGRQADRRPLRRRLRAGAGRARRLQAATRAWSRRRSRTSASRSSDAAGGELREVSPRRPLRLRLRLVAGRPAVRGGSRARLGHEQLLDRPSSTSWTRPAARRASIWKPPLQIALPALVSGRRVHRGHPRHHERRGLERRRRRCWSPPRAGAPRNLTPGFAGSASWLAWRPRATSSSPPTPTARRWSAP